MFPRKKSRKSSRRSVVRRLRSRSKADTSQNKAIVSLDKKIRTIQMSNEVKYKLQSDEIFSNIQTAPQTKLLNGLARGDTVQNRDGDVIFSKSILLKGMVICNLSAGPYAGCVRVMVVGVPRNDYASSLNFSAASPAEGYLFTNDNTNGPNIFQMVNFNATSVSKYFKIFYDKVFCLSQNTANIAMFKPFSTKIKLGNRKSTYKGGTVGDGSDLDGWSFWLVTYSDVDAAQTGLNIRYDVAYYYTD